MRWQVAILQTLRRSEPFGSVCAFTESAGIRRKRKDNLKHMQKLAADLIAGALASAQTFTGVITGYDVRERPRPDEGHT